MKTREQVERARQVLANQEIVHHRAGNLSPEQKAWIMGARAMAAWVLGLPIGGRKVQDLVGDGLPLLPVVAPFVGSQTLDQMRDPEGQ